MGDEVCPCPDCKATHVRVDVGTGTMLAKALFVRVNRSPPVVIQSTNAVEA